MVLYKWNIPNDKGIAFSVGLLNSSARVWEREKVVREIVEKSQIAFEMIHFESFNL